ncbi:MAG: DUF3857 and transglutaminase domain-containing protein [Deltaproteobacteria bacterium]|nr:DUF3857 and transglutaminase domain-containing protein [Deltaproteobacteria bacterium]
MGRLRMGALGLASLLMVLIIPCRGEALQGGEYSFLDLISPRDYPGAQVVVALEKERRSFDESGKGVTTDEVFLKILTERGLEGEAKQVFSYNMAYDRFEIEKIEVIKPRGIVRPVDLSVNSRTISPPGSAMMNIYDPNEREVHVFVPGLEVGDTIHYRVLYRRVRPVISGNFFGMILAQYRVPIREYLFEVEGPASVKLRYLLKDEVRDTHTFETLLTEDGKRVYRWRFRNVPMLVPEPHMPHISRVAMRLLFTTLSSWNEISKWYWGVVEPKLKPSGAMVRKVEELTAEESSEEGKIRALFSFVSRRVRYLGITTETFKPGFEPHDVKETFSQRAGVCRDKMALLVSMLRIAGFRSYPVLISIGPKIDPEIPRSAFNHAICGVFVKGRLMLLDPTAETSRQFLPDYDRDRSYLVAAPDMNNELSITPPRPAESNMTVVSITSTLDEQNHLRGRIRVTYSGFADTIFRGMLMERSAFERGRIVERLLKRGMPEAGVESFCIENLADSTSPLSLEITYGVKDAAIGEGKRGFLVPFSFLDNFSFLDRWVLGKADMVKRRYPIELGYRFCTRIHEELRLLGVRKIVLPPLPSLDQPLFRDSGSYGLVGPDRVVIDREFLWRSVLVSPSQYGSLKSLQHRRAVSRFLPIVFER